MTHTLKVTMNKGFLNRKFNVIIERLVKFKTEKWYNATFS